MALSYLNPGAQSVTHQTMNNLFGELDLKLAKTFGGGKSFILAADDYSWGMAEPPLMRLLGVPFFFHQTGTVKYIEPLINMVQSQRISPFFPFPPQPYSDNFLPYDEQNFIDAKNDAAPLSIDDPNFDPYDDERSIVKIPATDSDYWNRISVRGYPSANFYDYSLLKYKLDNSYQSYSFNNLFLENYAVGNVGNASFGTISSTFSGNSNVLYYPNFLIQGRSETKAYTSGVSEGIFYSGGVPIPSDANIWKLEISAPESHYYLNNGSFSPTVPVSLSKRRSIPISGNATVTLSFDLVDGLQINPPNPHWARISLDRVNPFSDGYYLQEIRQGGIDGYFCQPERTNRYALADIFVEDRTGIYLPGSGNKFDCYRIHNFNEFTLPVTIGTGFYYSMSQFECRTFRKFADGDWGTGYHYFLPYESGDPRYYTTVPLEYPINPFTFGTVTGLFSWQSVHSSCGANNLLNPSVLFDWIEAFSTETNPVGGLDIYSDNTYRGKKALLFQDIETTIYNSSHYYSGYYGYPINNNTLLGDLIHHTGLLKIAKISNTDLDVYGNPNVTFDSVLFKGYSTIVDDFAEKNIGVTESDNSYILSNLDSDNKLVLITQSTNLLKSGEYIPAAVDLPYELENFALDSSYYQDSWYRHVSGQNILFQTEIVNEVSGIYLTGDFIDTIKYYKHTIGDLKSTLGLGYSGITGSSTFSNFDFKLTPFGLYCDFEETIPALNSLIPYQDTYDGINTSVYLGPRYENIDEYSQDWKPINWFGEIKSSRKSAVPWTRLQGAWDLIGNELTRKRRLHFRGHGFGWSNLKYDSSLIQEQELAGLASFNSLYTNCKNGRYHLSDYGTVPLEYVNYGGIDFVCGTGNLNTVKGDLRINENINPYHRNITFFNYSGSAYEWERFPNFKHLDSKDSCLDLNRFQFSEYYHSETGINHNYKFGAYTGLVYVPILAEHWNAMAEKVNSIKYARPLSADQWYKVRLKQQIDGGPTYQYEYGRAIPIFKWFHIGYESDSMPYLGTQYSQTESPFKLPFDAYMVMNRQDMRGEWGLYDLDMPLDYYDWFDSNLNIRIKDANFGYDELLQNNGILISGFPTGVSSASLVYYDTFDFESGIINIRPEMSADYDFTNANSSPCPNPRGGYLAGIHYLTVEDVSAFFSGIGQEFYYKATFQPLNWKTVRNFSDTPFSEQKAMSNWLTTGHYNYSESGLVVQFSGTDLSESYLGGMDTLSLMKTILFPSSDEPIYKSNRCLQETTDGDFRKYRINRTLESQTGDASFIYNYTSGDSELRPYSEVVPNDYLSITHLTSAESDEFWAYERELLNSGNQLFSQLLPMGVALYSNNNNQLKWRMIGLKEYYGFQNEDYPFNSMENYRNHLLDFYTSASTETFKIDFSSAGTWTGCVSYITESYEPHILAEMHEPIIDL